MKLDTYLEALTNQIRCKLARGPITEEIRCHVEDQMEAYMAEGMTEAEAEEAAVLDMGDPVKTGAEFDRIHRPRMPWNMIGLIITLSLIGFCIQYMVIKQSGGTGSSVVDFGRQFLYLIIGFGIMIAVCFADYSRIVSRAFLIYLLFGFALRYGMNVFGSEVNGTMRWISIGTLNINVPILVCLYVPLYAAILCQFRGEGYFGFTAISAVILLRIFSDVLEYPSVYAACVLFLSFSFLLTLTVWRNWFRVSGKLVLGIYWGAIAAAAGGILLMTDPSSSYRISRFHRFFGFGEGLSYQMELLREMAEGAKWIGKGSYDGVELSYSDYMLAHVLDRYGIAAGIAVVAVILFLIVLLCRKCFAQKNDTGMLIGVSCTTVFLSQTILYVLSNLGLISTAGYCPFLTYGGNGIIVTYVLFGLLLCVFRYEKVMSLYKKKRPESYRTPKKKWQYEEQARILVIVLLLFLFLITEAN